MKIKEIAEFLDGEINGDPDLDINKVAEIGDAREGDLVFLFDEKKINELEGLEELAVIVPETMNECPARSWIRVKDVKAAMIKVLNYFYLKPQKIPEGYLADRKDYEHVKMGSDVKIGKNVFIGKNCVLENNILVFPFTYIGDNVKIGDNSVIYPNSVIFYGTEIGKKVVIYPGAVIGSDGFGYHQIDGKFEHVPQVGKVVIGDRVEIGALSMIDRGTIGDTVVGEGTKIDNSVHIAHNVRIGKNVIILAQVGIAGSCEIEDDSIIAGQVGISDHVKIGKGAKVAAKSGVDRDVEDGEVVFGYPADKRMRVMRNEIYFRRLPELFKRVEALEKSK